MGAVKESHIGEQVKQSMQRAETKPNVVDKPLKIEHKYTPEELKLIKDSVAKGATNNELALFLYQAKRKGLDPLSNQIHFSKFKTKHGPQVVIITGIDGYRAIAHRTGLLAGVSDAVYDEGLTEFAMKKDNRDHPETATISVKKIVSGHIVETTATAAWDEYYPPNKDMMWKKMPYLMLAKCAEALALRKAFPDDLSGIYTDAEMQQAHADRHRMLTDEEQEEVRELMSADVFSEDERTQLEETIQKKVTDVREFINRIRVEKEDREAALEES